MGSLDPPSLESAPPLDNLDTVSNVDKAIGAGKEHTASEDLAARILHVLANRQLSGLSIARWNVESLALFRTEVIAATVHPKKTTSARSYKLWERTETYWPHSLMLSMQIRHDSSGGGHAGFSNSGMGPSAGYCTMSAILMK